VNAALWIVAALLAVINAAVGAMKLTQPREKLAQNMAWAEHFTDAGVRAIGTLEVLGAIGLILPGALDIAPVLVPLAAAGLACMQIGALIANARYGEANRIPLNVILILLAVFVAWGRFGPYAF
jgi:uncharacterized membrane protein YphA (DoxX/SURF4 family)